MGKTSDNLSTLSQLIDTTNGHGAAIDEVPTEIKRSPGRPKKKVVSFYKYGGMTVPNEIYDICIFIESILKEQGKWSPALAFQVYNTAVQCWTYNDLITNKITQKEPVTTRQLTTASESLRRALQSTGLTVTDKKSGITKEQVEVNPLEEFIKKMNDGGEEVVISKKKGKKS